MLKEILEFMSGSPWLTFFLAVLVTECIVHSFEAVFRKTCQECERRKLREKHATMEDRDSMEG